jgi:hypothetical protein
MVSCRHDTEIHVEVRNVAKTGGTNVGMQTYGGEERLKGMQAIGRLRKELES